MARLPDTGLTPHAMYEAQLSVWTLFRGFLMLQSSTVRNCVGHDAYAAP